jgi:geranyl-CoA carboxylase alpha subunit
MATDPKGGMSFTKILIANRGEIACRVIRTARALGYRTVAVFSAADANAPHVQQADEAVPIGAAPAAESYLRFEALLDAARRTGADAVHPGYGFLSESAAFARACLDAGLVFIGPPPDAIEAMGDKALAKRRMLAAGVPCAPGYLGEDQADARFAAEAAQLGFPLLVKAVAGGGGRGMRHVRTADALGAAIEGARREATGAFGDGTLMLERLIENGRHIEIQVFADSHGNVVHLGERDCTSQRRRQKVIEESPSPVVDAPQREAMGRDAVAAARAVGYRGAGTVEFIVDGQGRHHFLEMNTRLQVEHPVTEMVTGLDLVEWQLRVAAGEPLPLTQAQVRFEGHAIEARLYAEDPYAGFVPQAGTVRWWRPDVVAARPGLRVDAGIAEGSVVSPYYDAMVAKVIAHGRDRDDAIRRLRAALLDLPLFGPRHNGRFLVDLLDHADFRAARMTTTRIDEWSEQGAAQLQRPVPDEAAWCLAAAAFALQHGAGWRADSVAAFDLVLACDAGERRTLRVRPQRDGTVEVTHEQQRHALERFEIEPGRIRCEWDGVSRSVAALMHGDTLHLAWQGATFVFDEADPVPDGASAVDARRAHAPVAGVIAKVAVGPGETVVAGQPLVCVEAMKMEMWVIAPAAARVTLLSVRAGDIVAAGALVVEFEPAAAD